MGIKPNNRSRRRTSFSAICSRLCRRKNTLQRRKKIPKKQQFQINLHNKPRTSPRFFRQSHCRQKRIFFYTSLNSFSQHINNRRNFKTTRNSRHSLLSPRTTNHPRKRKKIRISNKLFIRQRKNRRLRRNIKKIFPRRKFQNNI